MERLWRWLRDPQAEASATFVRFDPFEQEHHPPASVATVLRHPAPVTGLALDGTGTLLVTGCQDGSLHGWEWPGGQLRFSWRGQEVPASRLALSLDGATLASLGPGGNMYLWALPSGRLRGVAADQPTSAFAAWQAKADSLEGYLHLTYGSLNPLYLSDAHTLVTSTYLAYGPDGGPGGSYGSAALWFRIWEADGEGRVALRGEHFCPIGMSTRPLQTSPAPLVALGNGKSTRLVDARTGATRRLPLANPIGLSADGAWLLTGLRGGLARWEVTSGNPAGRWRLARNQPLIPYEPTVGQGGATREPALHEWGVEVQGATISRDGQQAALHSQELIRVEDLSPSQQLQARLTNTVGWHRSLLRWFDLTDGRLRLTRFMPRPELLSFSADGRFLFVAEGDTVQVYTGT